MDTLRSVRLRMSCRIDTPQAFLPQADQRQQDNLHECAEVPV